MSTFSFAIVCLLSISTGHSLDQDIVGGLASFNIQSFTADRISAGDELLTNAPEWLLGQPKVFEPAPPVGVHPRVILNAAELSVLAARFAERYESTDTFEKYFYDFTKTEFGPGNEALSLLEDVNVTGMDDEEKAAIVELGWGQRRNGNRARMDQTTADAMVLSVVHSVIQEELNGIESTIVKKLIKIMGTWAACIQSHARIYDCHEENVECRARPEGGFQGSLLWRKDWGLAQEWGTGSFGLAISYDLLWNKMVSGERLVVRESIRAAIARIVKGRYSWGIGLDSRRIVSNWGMSPRAFLSGFSDGLYLRLIHWNADVLLLFLFQILSPNSCPKKSHTTGTCGSQTLLLKEKGLTLLSSQITPGCLMSS